MPLATLNSTRLQLLCEAFLESIAQHQARACCLLRCAGCQMRAAAAAAGSGGPWREGGRGAAGSGGPSGPGPVVAGPGQEGRHPTWLPGLPGPCRCCKRHGKIMTMTRNLGRQKRKEGHPGMPACSAHWQSASNPCAMRAAGGPAPALQSPWSSLWMQAPQCHRCAVQPPPAHCCRHTWGCLRLCPHGAHGPHGAHMGVPAPVPRCLTPQCWRHWTPPCPSSSGTSACWTQPLWVVGQVVGVRGGPRSQLGPCPAGFY